MTDQRNNGQVSWQFGLYDGTSFETTTSHWFFDKFWSSEGDNGKHTAIQVTNNGSAPCFLSQVSLCLINGSSGGLSFTSANSGSHKTSASTATITAHCNNINSVPVSVSSNGTFHYSASAGQSYWSPRPSDSSGNQTGDNCDNARYAFKFPSGAIEITSDSSVVIIFTATWNTGSEHCIQIYADYGISIPVTHKVEFIMGKCACKRADGKQQCPYKQGVCNNSATKCIQCIEDGNDATVPAIQTPIDNFKNIGWKLDGESDLLNSESIVSKCKNVKKDLKFTAQWEIASHTVVFNMVHSVCLKANKGGCAYKSNCTNSDKTCTQTIEDGQAATLPVLPSIPTEDTEDCFYKFNHWNENNTDYKIVKKDLQYTAIWDSAVIWKYHVSEKKWKKELFPYKYTNSSDNKWSSLTAVHKYNSGGWDNNKK